MKKHRKAEYPSYLSPLQLIYTAYTSEQPVFDTALSPYFQTLDQLLASLSEQEKHAAFQAVYHIYTEKERQAFLSGVHAGIQLLREVDEI